MQVTGSFPEGIITEDGIFQGFVLMEQTFRTTLEIAHDPDIDKELINDEVYYSACLMSKRLQVEGLDRVTPEQVLDLSALDTAELINKTNALETQRANFRDAAKAAAEERDRALKAGDNQD